MHEAKTNLSKNAAESASGSRLIDLGQAFAPLSPAYSANPYDFYKQAHEQESVFFSELYNMWMVTRYEDVTTILKDSRRFAIVDFNPWEKHYTPEVHALMNTSRLVPSIVVVDPPEHTRLRICLNKAFSPQSMSGLEPSIRSIADQLINEFVDKGQVDIQAQFARPYSAQVMGSLANFALDELEQLQAWSSEMATFLLGGASAQEQISLAQATVAIHNYFYRVTEQNWTMPGDDLVGNMIKEAQAQPEPLSIAEAASLLYTLIIAGLHTTPTFLGNCFYQLLHERTRWLTIVDDPESIPTIAEEIMRLDPPGLGVLRRTTETVVVGGKTIPAGAILHLLVAAANHDPACFHDPEAFRPERENASRQLGFGYGVHYCTGAPLARLVVRVALEQFSQRLPSLRLTPDQQFCYVASLNFHGFSQLSLEWTFPPLASKQ
ncbi:MAG: cytochrome P450 [Chloroflexi bacterium]|nr:MAG: cytochrome P450 [Chloroflexota bacterium]